MAALCKIVRDKWLEWVVLAFFAILAAAAIATPMICPILADSKYNPAFNAALSIGTSGVVAFVFYYAVNERLEKRKRKLVREATLRAYQDAKHNIARAIIFSSRKGGRHDLVANTETIEKILTVTGFKELFAQGSESDEGFYAFENQMSDHTSEYDEIVFNLKIMGRAFNRLIDTNHFEDRNSYDFFVRLDALVSRIERNGPGYEESKPLCKLIWEIFAGWNLIKGNIGYDPIERAIKDN